MAYFFCYVGEVVLDIIVAVVVIPLLFMAGPK